MDIHISTCPWEKYIFRQDSDTSAFLLTRLIFKLTLFQYNTPKAHPEYLQDAKSDSGFICKNKKIKAQLDFSFIKLDLY